MSKRIFVPLASEPFWRFVAGTKTFEVRAANSPVGRKVRKSNPGAEVLLRRGYSTPDELRRRLGAVYVAASWDALPEVARRGADRRPEDTPGRYYDPGGEVVAFECLA